jgi:hypothetical protein
MTAQARRAPQRWLPRVMRSAYAIAAVLAAVVTVGAQAATADSFERGDVLASVGNPSVIARFAPDGTAKGTLADSAGAGPLCFDPAGEHLVAPGTGLYDSTGTRLASQWGSASLRGACTVDKAGNVYVAGGVVTGDPLTHGTIRRFDLTGHLQQSYDVDASGMTYGRAVASVDLAPDQCTIYYDLGGSDDVKRFDVCTGTQLTPFGSAGFPCDELRVRADGEVVVTCDTYGRVLDTSGVATQTFKNPTVPLTNSLRFAALDSDGRSFWMGSYSGQLARFDIASGNQIGQNLIAGTSLGGVAVYSPPPPPPKSPPGGTTTTQTTSDAHAVDGTAITGGLAFSSAPSLAAPAFLVTHGRLITSGGSLRLDTGLQATCPAGGPKCSANVTLTVAGTGARASAASATRVGTLNTKIAPGAKAKLVVRLSKKGAALIRRRHAVTIAARVSIRAGSGPAVVRKTSVRVLLRRPR